MRSLRRSAAVFPILLAVGITLLIFLLPGIGIPDKFTFPFALGLAIILSLWHARRLVRPIQNLIPQVDSQGHLSFVGTTRLAVPPEEVQALSEAMDAIARKLEGDREARQKLERVRSEFLANVSHELRTPIFAVQGFIETLLDGAIDDPKVNRDFLERAHVQSERLNNLLSDLIDISRIESGEMRMSFRVFDLQPFLRELTNELQILAKAKNIDLYFTGNVLPHHEVQAYADKDRVKQILINLVDNAIKYSGEGSSIKIELANSEPTPHEVTIRVSDNGIGIAPEHLPRLFERFYRVNKDRSRSSPGGTGLGLAIVKHLVEAHHGKIMVTSEPGKGSTFQVILNKDPF
ncbi:MAG: ATP-binding protein [Bacteroidota bacterium]|nr:ATP-binding protein [Bacteroidota bacterium]MDP4234234.1 ATP-binding protein [Bacteroidota bacterium]MDP4243424.1 ATP-binding protein [Bacteroidota bacterium]MDP4288123.1 ATP-binding protein [Bacteroidota bacterium]